jgi:hypothetical protein
MYSDPRRVRTRYASIKLDEYEAQLIDAVVNYTGESRAAVLRALILREAMSVLGLPHTESIDRQAS